jgi:hypothetical protein
MKGKPGGRTLINAQSIQMRSDTSACLMHAGVLIANTNTFLLQASEMKVMRLQDCTHAYAMQDYEKLSELVNKLT